MYRTMENTTAVSSLFFVALIVLGEVGGAERNQARFQVPIVFPLQQQVKTAAVCSD